MRSLSLGVIAVAMGLGIVSMPAWAQPRQVRIGLVAGNNVGRDPARSLRYAEDEVGRLADLLKSAGDFDDVTTLRGATRGEMEKELLRVRDNLEAAKAQGNQTLFLFYFSGHGDNEALEIGSERFPLRDLRSYLEQLKGADVRVAFVDACQSGALTGVKGGRRVPGYQLRLADPGQIKGMAIITSSTANEFSQESDDLKGSFFSQSIIAGLRGAADVSHDGQVTLGEVYQFAFNRTLANTAASLVGGQHPTYDYRIAGAGEVVLTRTRANDARLAFVREEGSTYTVIGKGKGEVVAEIPSSTSDDLYLALPAGDYGVIRRTMGNVRESRLALVAGGTTVVDPNAMTDVPQASVRGKSSGLELRQRLGASVGVGTSVVPGSSTFLGTLALSYAYDFGPVATRARAQMASFDSLDQGYRSSRLRLGVGLDALLPLLRTSRWMLQLGPAVGMPVFRQSDATGSVTNSYGFSYGAAAVVSLRLAGSSYLALDVGGGGEAFRLDGARVQRATGSALLGGIVAF